MNDKQLQTVNVPVCFRNFGSSDFFVHRQEHLPLFKKSTCTWLPVRRMYRYLLIVVVYQAFFLMPVWRQLEPGATAVSWYWRIAMWFQGPVLLGRMERPAGRSCYPSTFFFSVLLACKLYYSYVNSTNTLGQHKFSKKNGNSRSEAQR